MSQRNEKDKKFLAVVQELSGLLISYKWDEAYTKVGELNSLLKNREELTLPSYMIDMAASHVKSFYYHNNIVNKSHKSMVAIGHKLDEFK